MAEIIKMPKMSDTMEVGVISAWLKKVGDQVESGDILAEVETDKATMELESYNDGVLLYIGIKEKESVPVDGIIAVIGEKGEDYEKLLKENSSPSKELQTSNSSQQNNVDISQINANIIRMPKMSDTMTVGIVSNWLKKVGDQVESGDVLAEVETDKATMELEAYEEGTLLYTAAEKGTEVPVDDVIAIIGEKGTNYQPLLEGVKNQTLHADSEKVTQTPSPSKETTPTLDKNDAFVPAEPFSNEGKRIKVSPLAKIIAQEKGINLLEIKGTGDDGRIIKKDVDSLEKQSISISSTSKTQTLPVGQEYSEKIALSQMRRVIAKKLSESKFSAPHFYLTMEINMDQAIQSRKSLNEISPVKLSFNDMVVKAAAVALKQNPDVNVSWTDDHLIKHHHVHMGIAVAVPEGLIVPVVRFVDSKSLSQISSEIKNLVTKAKEKKIQPEEFSGNTFTISNLGMFGIEEFTGIINPPDACIMAVGAIKETVIVKNGEIKIGHTMKVTLSCDHRAVDGAVGSIFLRTFKNLMEDPVRILI